MQDAATLKAELLELEAHRQAITLSIQEKEVALARALGPFDIGQTIRHKGNGTVLQVTDVRLCNANGGHAAKYRARKVLPNGALHKTEQAIHWPGEYEQLPA